MSVLSPLKPTNAKPEHYELAWMFSPPRKGQSLTGENKKTRMHSSRMRTVRCSGRISGGGGGIIFPYG